MKMPRTNLLSLVLLFAEATVNAASTTNCILETEISCTIAATGEPCQQHLSNKQPRSASSWPCAHNHNKMAEMDDDHVIALGNDSNNDDDSLVEQQEAASCATQLTLEYNSPLQQQDDDTSLFLTVTSLAGQVYFADWVESGDQFTMSADDACLPNHFVLQGYETEPALPDSRILHVHVQADQTGNVSTKDMGPFRLVNDVCNIVPQMQDGNDNSDNTCRQVVHYQACHQSNGAKLPDIVYKPQGKLTHWVSSTTSTPSLTTSCHDVWDEVDVCASTDSLKASSPLSLEYQWQWQETDKCAGETTARLQTWTPSPAASNGGLREAPRRR